MVFCKRLLSVRQYSRPHRRRKRVHREQKNRDREAQGNQETKKQVKNRRRFSFARRLDFLGIQFLSSWLRYTRSTLGSVEEIERSWMIYTSDEAVITKFTEQE
ncbi:hypothetical protein R1flu_011574 [Riccia fluitans]|uniref:Uncharacterized protein n=1 Tax=Riccia fluitans TaxID=41844 RepID=A0ABD1ZBH0_9MARC